ncbi:hypothetical protein ACFQNF_03375 [Iodobacter arcticus]|uniref:Uncharacterized protein n=1 Tax=Iodobacter arcticus TaxID=590593 RepID=A0ABW2QTZ6_9NEIS
MRREEQSSGQDYIQTFTWSPLVWLANLPVIPPRHKAKVMGAALLLLLFILIYWLAPRLGVSPFHVRQDGLNYAPYFTDVQVSTDRKVSQGQPLVQAELSLLGSWPGFTLSQYSSENTQQLVLRNRAGKIEWQAVIDVPGVGDATAATPGRWIGRFKLIPASSGWAWSGGWSIDIESDRIAWGKIYLAPDASLRIIRHQPNAAAFAALKTMGA